MAVSAFVAIGLTQLDRIGWLRAIDEQEILDVLPDGASCRSEAEIGQFVTPATRLCAVWPSQAGALGGRRRQP